MTELPEAVNPLPALLAIEPTNAEKKPGRVQKHGTTDTYDPVVAQTVIDHIAGGGLLKTILPAEGLKSGQRFPAVKTWWYWCDRHPELKSLYLQARERQATNLFEQVLELAEAVTGKTGIDPKRAQVAISAIQWAAGKLSPQQYGERRITTPAVAIQIITTLPLEPGQERRAEDASPYVITVKTQEPVQEVPADG